ncbi:hypothetical protein RB195_021309 [Necator americanus]
MKQSRISELEEKVRELEQQISQHVATIEAKDEEIRKLKTELEHSQQNTLQSADDFNSTLLKIVMDLEHNVSHLKSLITANSTKDEKNASVPSVPNSQPENAQTDREHSSSLPSLKGDVEGVEMREGRRKRRATLRIGSLKEPRINVKLRRPTSNNEAGSLVASSSKS